MSRPDPEGDQIPFLRDRNRAPHGFEQGLRIADVMIARKDEQHVVPIDGQRGQGDRGRGPSRTGFEEQPSARRKSRNFVCLTGCADDKRRQEKFGILDARERLLDHCSTADDLEEVLRPIFRGNRPQSRAPASRENDRLNSFYHTLAISCPALPSSRPERGLCNRDTDLFFFGTD
jgi:hypothetical protein